MKRLKFFGLISVLLILALVLVIKSDFISKAWAKPPYAEYKISNGYAKLTDTSEYLIWSDSGSQYIDSNIRKANGEDRITITTNKTTGAYVKSFSVLGIVERESSRKVRFRFNIANYTQRLVGVPKAVLDILTTKGTPDGTVHFRVVDDTTNSANDNVAFIIDPEWDGTSQDAITQTTVDAFYGTHTDDYELSVNGHVIYYLDYPSGITAVGPNPTWTFTHLGGPTLYVKKKVGTVYERMDLATYGALPFSLTISLNNIP